MFGRGAPSGSFPALPASALCRLLSSRRGFRRRLRRGGGRGVAELFLGTEEQVEQLAAQPLACDQRSTPRQKSERNSPAHAVLGARPLAWRRGLLERLGNVLDGVRGPQQLPLQATVQVAVLQQPLQVGVRAR